MARPQGMVNCIESNGQLKRRGPRVFLEGEGRCEVSPSNQHVTKCDAVSRTLNYGCRLGDNIKIDVRHVDSGGLRTRFTTQSRPMVGRCERGNGVPVFLKSWQLI
jgi:hypothetical protein